MQHIGIDARLTYYRKGGISTYMRRLVTALELLDNDHRYTVFHSRRATESLVQQCGPVASASKWMTGAELRQDHEWGWRTTRLGSDFGRLVTPFSCRHPAFTARMAKEQADRAPKALAIALAERAWKI